MIRVWGLLKGCVRTATCAPTASSRSASAVRTQQVSFTRGGRHPPAPSALKNTARKSGSDVSLLRHRQRSSTWGAA